jgi:hypothetical protein
MVPSSTPENNWHWPISMAVQASRVRRSTASWRVLVAHMWSWLSTPHASLGTTAWVTRKLAWAWAMEATTDPWCSVLAARKSTTLSSLVRVWRWRKSSPVPVTANSGAQPTPAALGRSRKSSVWTWTSRAVDSARSM